MKPITDDVVKSLIEGLESREKKALKRPHDEIGRTGSEAGSMTARVLRFSRRSRASGEVVQKSAAVMDLLEARRSRHANRTLTGLFLYSAQF